MAANLFQLSWNDELARIAQAWAFQCQLSSECYECRAPVTRPYTFTGQNVHQLSGAPTRRSTDNLSQVKEWKAVIESWYSEVVYVDESLVRSYAPVSQNKSIGHYTQMLWASTYEIGCGQVTFGPCMELVNNAPAFLEKCQLFVCNYGPAGNQITHPVYSIGPAGTMCPYGTSSQYNELCITPPKSTN
ncbi:scoloptoxin SSD976 [Hyalella azteca]|uniref:Scoloptoxin SSD976 n=1 Tax=Hyalella azteca TaxID=294128 RepID=A0A8B7PAD0_HYAAZ|nr:scoloptoxin SSD976 [Hyalella azteca]